MSSVLINVLVQINAFWFPRVPVPFLSEKPSIAGSFEGFQGEHRGAVGVVRALGVVKRVRRIRVILLMTSNMSLNTCCPIPKSQGPAEVCVETEIDAREKTCRARQQSVAAE